MLGYKGKIRYCVRSDRRVFERREKVLVTKKKSDGIASSEVPANFEQAIAELEQIVASMEQGELTLEASMAAYARGVLLAKACQAQLQAAQQQVQVLEQDLLKPLQSSGDEESM